MSSQNFISSPISPTTRRARRSKFTWKHLSTLAHSATNCPLRVIAHIDLDAFYAQCEMVRLDIDKDQPLAVQQWQGLIAINYPARAYGLNRHVTITEAKEKCPDIICQHVATWKEGNAKWEYADDAFKEIAIRKVSLDPYRIESRKILKCIKDTLPADKQRVEKASIDEVFLDLSAHVHSILLERYPELRGPPPYDDPSEPLPKPPTTVLDWKADALVDLDEKHTEEDDPDWDDIVILIASEIVRDVRAAVFRELKYTMSAGISRNKMLAKLGSGHKKPNSQTVVRNRAVQHFLSGYKFTKIRNLGGKLGDQVVAAFNTDTVAELLPVPIEQLKKQLGDDTGSWLYDVLRGEDNSEVNPRTQIKSMLSAKSFRPSINSFEVACKWLRIFVADIFGRLVEEGVLENKRRPKTINIHHRQGQQTRSKQAPIPLGKTISEDILFDLAKNLLAQVIVDGRAWPCANLSLSVGGFEDGVTGNMGINGFLVRGEEAKAMQAASLHREDSAEKGPSRKKRRIKNGGIPIVFAHKYNSWGSDVEDEDDASPGPVEDEQLVNEYDEAAGPPTSAQQAGSTNNISTWAQANNQRSSMPTHTEEGDISADLYTCERCGKRTTNDERAEHEDFHFAQDLQRQQTSPGRPPPKPGPATAKPAPTSSKAKGKGRGRPPSSGVGQPEKGQRRLAFG
ncbi:Putative UmuC domain, DNA polymerase, Y-family, little finger domain, DNA/RNA polymerase superfamily [Septoria linicola]|uniref:DNA polymerase eta n=1 Tax=Septoria linicola TaxID=215465 RepID=A0A9Q9ANG0_9PEZI|nr:putative UmuC domain, DNA polymerase, Y-family, little finger domain, DNA/RNA polymerase superfamily [Septoria linicola]USW52190.1 Putative UmuC domain, DNA polymerase, Y-family, little finger domain, DNA/RNA polymerase superfamily [Septoria linicola]